jgi:hypothetical protein
MPRRSLDADSASESYIGCCGAYCKTCQEYTKGLCKGCKLGYGEGGRDITRAKCRIKVCCFGERGYQTCADCADLDTCDIIHSFHDKSGYKYRKYREAMGFIRDNGYPAFMKRADKWKGPYGKLQ